MYWQRWALARQLLRRSYFICDSAFAAIILTVALTLVPQVIQQFSTQAQFKYD